MRASARRSSSRSSAPIPAPTHQSQMRHHLGGGQLHVLELVEDGVEEKVLRAGADGGCQRASA